MFCFLVTCGKLAVVPLYIIKKKKKREREKKTSWQSAGCHCEIGTTWLLQKMDNCSSIGNLVLHGHVPLFLQWVPYYAWTEFGGPRIGRKVITFR